MYNFETKYGLINWLKDDFIIAFYPTTDEKVENIKNILLSKDYDELYRLANMVQRFGWEAIFEVFELESKNG